MPSWPSPSTPKTWTATIVTVPDLNTEIRDRFSCVKTSIDDNGHAYFPVIQTKTSTYTVVGTDDIINCTSGTFTVTLLTAVGRAGKPFVIKNTGAGVVTVNTTSSQTMDSVTTLTLLQGDSVTVVSDGANWIIAQYYNASALRGSARTLYSNSGTDTNAAATVVDSFAISGLAALDRLMAIYHAESTTQDTATPQFRHVTDSVSLLNLSAAGSVGPTNGDVRGCAYIQQKQSGSTALTIHTNAYNSAATDRSGASNPGSITTAWTGSWTLGIRHQGVTAGGTFKWSWSVIKVPAAPS